MQVHVYLPGRDHPAHDTVRAIVKDDTDKFNGDSSRVWVDSGAPQLQPCIMQRPWETLVVYPMLAGGRHRVSR